MHIKYLLFGGYKEESPLAKPFEIKDRMSQRSAFFLTQMTTRHSMV